MRIDIARALFRSGDDVLLCLDTTTLDRLGLAPGAAIRIAAPSTEARPAATTLKRRPPSPGAMEGSKVPSFTMEDQDGGKVTDRSLAGQAYVLYFYPKDDTPGCTKEACGIRDAFSEFREAGLKVFGVSKDDAGSHQRFRAKFDLPFDLLVADERTLESFGVWREKNMYGRKYMGINRETLLVDAGGTIVRHFEKVKPEEHAQEILAAWKALA